MIEENIAESIQFKFDEAVVMVELEPESALKTFEELLGLAEKHSIKKYSFEATKHVVLLTSKLGLHYKMMQNTRSLLVLVDTVPQEQVINAIN